MGCIRPAAVCVAVCVAGCVAVCMAVCMGRAGSLGRH